MSWLIGAGCVALAVGGALLAFPGEGGRHLAGLTMIIGALQGVLTLLRRR